MAFFKFIPNHPIFASKVLLLQSIVEINNSKRHKRDIDYFEFLEEIKICFRDKYEYFDVANSVWWESFFNNQSDIISRSRNKDTPLKTSFIWSQNISNEHEQRHIIE